MFLKLVAILSVAVLPILGQYVHDGECRSDVEVVQNFDVEKVNWLSLCGSSSPGNNNPNPLSSHFPVHGQVV